MRVLICGDRNWENKALIFVRMSYLPVDTVIIEGEAKGADSIAREQAEYFGFEIEKYPADWKKYGKAAGPIRNKQMITEGKPDLVIAFHNDLDRSKGTKNMVKQAEKAGIPVEIISEFTS